MFWLQLNAPKFKLILPIYAECSQLPIQYSWLNLNFPNSKLNTFNSDLMNLTQNLCPPPLSPLPPPTSRLLPPTHTHQTRKWMVRKSNVAFLRWLEEINDYVKRVHWFESTWTLISFLFVLFWLLCLLSLFCYVFVQTENSNIAFKTSKVK